MLLEVAWEALEHAGIPPDSLSGTRTGVMMGLSSWDYTIVNIERRADIDAYLSTGTPHCAAVGRIAYLLGLRGPAVAVDTACSSSLVAIHLACQSLRLRETDVALAGGVQLTLSPFTAIALSSGRRCHRPADATASTPTRMDSCAARAAAWWCSSGWPTRCATRTGCLRWSAVRQLTPMVGPTA